MENASTNSDLISEVSSLADSDIRDLDFDSVNVETYTQLVEVSVHQGPGKATSAIVGLKQAPTMDILVSELQCATLLMCTPAPPLGSTPTAPLLVQSICVAAPLLFPGPSFPQGSQSPITMQGPHFPPIASMPIMFSGGLGMLGVPGSIQSAGAPPQSTAIPPMAGAPWPSQTTPYPSAFMTPPGWLMYMLSYLPRPPAQQASMQAEREELARQHHDLEARELDVEWRNRALNLNAVRDARVAPVAGSSHSRAREQAPWKPKRSSSQVAS